MHLRNDISTVSKQQKKHFGEKKWRLPNHREQQLTVLQAELLQKCD